MKLVARSAFAVLLTGAPLLAACGTPFDAEAGSGPRVVTSFYPLQYVAERVAGDHFSVVNLTSPGAEPHDLELTVEQTAEVVEAEVVVYQEGFQPAVDEAIAQTSPDHLVEAGQAVTLEETGAQDSVDRHFWHDPTKMSALATEVADQLSEADPEHQADYESNLGSLQDDLTALDHEFRTGLSECAIDTVVVSHDAFGYLGARYDLDMHPINGLTPDAEPSPAHLRELQQLIEQEGVTTVFSETLASPELAETLAGDLGIRTGVLDPIEGLTENTSDQDYLSLMRDNLAALQKAGDCR